MTPPSPIGKGEPRRYKCSQPCPSRVHIRVTEGPLCSLVGGGPRNTPQIWATVGGKASLLWLLGHHLLLEAVEGDSWACPAVSSRGSPMGPSGNGANMPILSFEADVSTHLPTSLWNSTL